MDPLTIPAYVQHSNKTNSWVHVKRQHTSNAYPTTTDDINSCISIHKDDTVGDTCGWGYGQDFNILVPWFGCSSEFAENYSNELCNIETFPGYEVFSSEYDGGIHGYNISGNM